MTPPSRLVDPAALRLARDALGDRASVDGALGARTTYRVGGAAALLVAEATPDDLPRVSEAHRASGLPVLVVGNGSNLLVADSGFPGIAVVLGPAFRSVTIQRPDTGDGVGPVLVTAGAAMPLPLLARRTVREGLTGFEWAVGVPGTVGGAVRMNAGGHGSDMASVLVAIHRFDLSTGQDEDVPAGDLDLSYRHSAIGPEQVVTSATVALRPGSPEDATRALDEIVTWRRENQPGGQNAGSVFTNPPGDSAGRLVDAAGLKGHRLRTAQVSPKHANFIQADDAGSADDVVALIGHVRRAVHAHCGVELVPEVRLVGFDADLTAGALGPLGGSQ